VIHLFVALLFLSILSWVALYMLEGRVEFRTHRTIRQAVIALSVGTGVIGLLAFL
jgi:hypothetical protein